MYIHKFTRKRYIKLSFNNFVFLHSCINVIHNIVLLQLIKLKQKGKVYPLILIENFFNTYI